ncbi:MAG: hypothetical protein WBB98_14420 [Xanthobacteraceae bacterium]
MATAEELAIRLNNLVVENLPQLYSAQPRLAAVCNDLIETLSSQQRAEFGDKLLAAIKHIPSGPLTRANAWQVIDSLTHPIYDLLLAMKEG